MSYRSFSNHFDKLNVHLKKEILVQFPDYSKVVEYILNKNTQIFSEFEVAIHKKSWNLNFSNITDLYVSQIRDHFTIKNKFLHKITYTLEGSYHREGDKPAVIWENGDKQWLKHGEYHREGDKSAYIKDGDESWWKYGKLHREKGQPAYLCSNGFNSWYIKGKFIKSEII